jgi:hypothetical protein
MTFTNPCKEILLPTITTTRPHIFDTWSVLSNITMGIHPVPFPTLRITKIRGSGRPLSLPQSKYKFTRKNWHKADMWKSDELTSNVDAWCTENFGPQPKNPDAWCRWSRDILSTYYFRDEKDYFLFRLRWGS